MFQQICRDSNKICFRRTLLIPDTGHKYHEKLLFLISRLKMFTKYHDWLLSNRFFFIFRFKTNKLNQLGFTTMHVMPFVLKRKIKKKRFDKKQLWYLVNIFSLDIRNKSFSWYLWSVSGIRRVRLKQILLESRQICWNTFLRYALYNVDSTIIWFLVDFKKKYNSQNWRRRELDKLVEEACVCTKFCDWWGASGRSDDRWSGTYQYFSDG